MTQQGPPHDEDWESAGSPWQQSPTQQPPPQQSQQPLPQQPQWQPGVQAPQARNIPTYLIPAILVTLLCFLPTGIVAIVYASQVSSKIGVGDFQGATKASNSAKTWTIVSVVVGLLVGVIVFAATASGY